MDEVIEKARAMRAKFCEKLTLNSPLAISTEKFAAVVEEELDITITTKYVPQSEMADLRGLVAIQSDGNAIILISDENNRCWRRFVFVKELCHLFLGEARCTDVESLATSLIYRDMEQDRDYFLREVSGVAAAIEIMIPEHLKERLAHDVNVKGINSKTLARRMVVPQKYVDYRLRQWNIPVLSAEDEDL